MTFAEDLPPLCPPNDAEDTAYPTIFRLLPEAQPTELHFHSYAKLGKVCPEKVDGCRWASCSLVFDPVKMKKLPRFKNCKYAAKLAIPQGAGVSRQTNANHVDFWCLSSFSMLNSITEIVEI